MDLCGAPLERFQEVRLGARVAAALIDRVGAGERGERGDANIGAAPADRPSLIRVEHRRAVTAVRRVNPPGEFLRDAERAERALAGHGEQYSTRPTVRLKHQRQPIRSAMRVEQTSGPRSAEAERQTSCGVEIAKQAYDSDSITRLAEAD